MADSGATRVARHRAHVAGDHSKCRPETCPDAQVKTGDAERARRYRRRRRLHGSGDHSMCLPGKCPALDDRDATEVPAVMVAVTPDTNLAVRGQALWDSVTAGSDLAPLHRELLLEACRCVDRLERLDRQLHGEDWLRFRTSEDQTEVTVYVDRVLSEAREQQNTLKALVLELVKAAAAQSEPEKKGGILYDLAAEFAGRGGAAG